MIYPHSVFAQIMANWISDPAYRRFEFYKLRNSPLTLRYKTRALILQDRVLRGDLRPIGH